MTSLIGSTATLRRRLLGALTATGLGGTAVVALLSAPTAVSSTDPCAASEMAKTISNVARSAGDYLDGHPAANQAMTSAVHQQSELQSYDSLRAYFEADPKAASDLQTIALPLSGLSSKCQTPPISLPQVLGFTQSSMGGSPPVVSSPQSSLPRSGAAAAPVVSGPQGVPPQSGASTAPVLGVVK